MNRVKVVDTYNFNELRDKIFYSNTFGPKKYLFTSWKYNLPIVTGKQIGRAHV